MLYTRMSPYISKLLTYKNADLSDILLHIVSLCHLRHASLENIERCPADEFTVTTYNSLKVI